MKQFVVGVPIITFVNCQTKEEIEMFLLTDYNKFGDEIVVDYVAICNQEYEKILSWLLNENCVNIKLKFNIYNNDEQNMINLRTGEYYEECYPVIMVYKPFVKSSNNESAGVIEFKIKVRE